MSYIAEYRNFRALPFTDASEGIKGKEQYAWRRNFYVEMQQLRMQ